MSFFQISLKNSELKTTHNTFRDCALFSDNLSRNSCGQFQLFLLQWRIQGRAPSFLDQTEARTAEKKFFETPPPLSQGPDDRAPPLSEGLDPSLFC